MSDIFGSDGSGDERDLDDEDMDGVDNQAPATKKKKKEKRKLKALTDRYTEKPTSLIAILYLACATMKIPALSIDFIRFVLLLLHATCHPNEHIFASAVTNSRALD